MCWPHGQWGYVSNFVHGMLMITARIPQVWLAQVKFLNIVSSAIHFSIKVYGHIFKTSLDKFTKFLCVMLFWLIDITVGTYLRLCVKKIIEMYMS